MSLQKLLESIEREAQGEAERIVSQARDEARGIRQQARDGAQAEAEELRRTHVERCRKEAEQRLSQARLQARNRTLEVRHELVDTLFDQARCVLRTIDDDLYRAWMKRQILRLYRSDEETVVVSTKDRDRLTAHWLQEVNRALQQEGHVRRLQLEYTTTDLDGGFILRHPGYEVDMGFRVLLEALKTRMQAEIATTLFEVEHADVLDHGF